MSERLGPHRVVDARSQTRGQRDGRLCKVFRPSASSHRGNPRFPHDTPIRVHERYWDGAFEMDERRAEGGHHIRTQPDGGGK